MDPSSTKTDISVVAATTTVRVSTTHPEEEISSSRGLRLFSPVARPAFYPMIVAALSYLSSLSFPPALLFRPLRTNYDASIAVPRSLLPIAPFAATNSRFRRAISVKLYYFTDILIFININNERGGQKNFPFM